MHQTAKRTLVIAAAVLLPASAAIAHPGHAGHDALGVWAGFVHPFTGVDHMLAMVSVGLWAALRGERALVTWPATFVVAMLAGFAAGNVLGAIPMVEPAILASVIALGALTAANARMPAVAGLGLIALFGALHGFAHGAEAMDTTPGFEFGMIAATAALHAVGVGVGLALKRFGRIDLVRFLGLGAAAGGLVLAVAG